MKYVFSLAISSLFILLGCGKSTNGEIDTNSEVYQLGFVDGWSAYSTDSWAVGEYHRRADELENDEEPEALARIWKEVKENAAAQEKQWNNLSKEEKLANVRKPFWKRDVGEPRRLSRKAKEEMADALRKFGEQEPNLSEKEL